LFGVGAWGLVRAQARLPDGRVREGSP